MNFIFSFFNQPAIIIGVIALIGLIALKRPVDKIITGTFKTVIGFVILSQGGNIISSALTNLSPAFESAFNVRGVIPSNEAVIGTAQKMFGSEMALIMAFGFLCNILIARFTKFKYIFLSGHHILFMSALLSAVLSTLGFKGPELVIVGSIFLGIVMTLSPAVTQPFYRKVTGNDNVAMGHFNGISYCLSPMISKLVGNKEHSTESIKMPKKLSFFKDNTISTALVMLILYVVTFLLAKKSVVLKLSEGDNIVMFAIMQAIIFTAGFVVVLQGVRMMLAEIVPAFKGISQKIVPDATPALDVPVIFPYAPNAVLIGFVSSTVGGLIVFALLPLSSLPIIIPGLINLFFVGAGVGVLSNAVGGIRGTIVGGLFNGALITFLPALMLPVLGKLGFNNSTFGDADFAVVGITIGHIGQSLGKAGIYGLLVVLLLILGVGSVIKAHKEVKDPEIPDEVDPV
ncbi:PTS ascorbate transporter subunit IIC [Paucilactobacillus sp. N302-9]